MKFSRPEAPPGQQRLPRRNRLAPSPYGSPDPWILRQREAGWNDRFFVSSRGMNGKRKILESKMKEKQEQEDSQSSLVLPDAEPKRGVSVKYGDGGRDPPPRRKRERAGGNAGRGPPSRLVSQEEQAQLRQVERAYALQNLATRACVYREQLLMQVNAIVVNWPRQQKQQKQQKQKQQQQQQQQQQQTSPGGLSPSAKPQAARLLRNISVELREAGLRCVEKIVAWVLCVSVNAAQPARFLWHGQDYLSKMHSDMDFVLLQIGTEASTIGNFGRGNPLLLSREELTTKSKGRLGRAAAATFVIMDVVKRQRMNRVEDSSSSSPPKQPVQQAPPPPAPKGTRGSGEQESGGATAVDENAPRASPKKRRASLKVAKDDSRALPNVGGKTKTAAAAPPRRRGSVKSSLSPGKKKAAAPTTAAEAAAAAAAERRTVGDMRAAAERRAVVDKRKRKEAEDAARVAEAAKAEARVLAQAEEVAAATAAVAAAAVGDTEASQRQGVHNLASSSTTSEDTPPEEICELEKGDKTPTQGKLQQQGEGEEGQGVVEEIGEEAEADNCGFEELDMVGEGAFGWVHMCRVTPKNTLLGPEYQGQIVAVKTFKPAEEGDDEETQAHLEHTQRRELALCQEISHKNIIKTLGVMQQQGQQQRRKRQQRQQQQQQQLVIQQPRQAFVVFDYMPSNALDVLKGLGRQQMAKEDVCSLTLQLLQALSYLHKRGIIHRDIKPENLLVDMSQRPPLLKICDFGAARHLPIGSSELTAGRQPSRVSVSANSEGGGSGGLGSLTHYVGSRWYRAPEMLANATVYGAGVDVWAGACLIAELSTGEALFEGDDESEMVLAMVGLLGPLPYSQAKRLLRGGIEREAVFPPQQESKGPARTIENLFRQRLGAEGVSLLRGMLVYDVSMRLSARDCVQHSFFFPPAAPLLAGEERSTSASASSSIGEGASGGGGGLCASTAAVAPSPPAPAVRTTTLDQEAPQQRSLRGSFSGQQLEEEGDDNTVISGITTAKESLYGDDDFEADDDDAYEEEEFDDGDGEEEEEGGRGDNDLKDKKEGGGGSERTVGTVHESEAPTAAEEAKEEEDIQDKQEEEEQKEEESRAATAAVRGPAAGTASAVAVAATDTAPLPWHLLSRNGFDTSTLQKAAEGGGRGGQNASALSQGVRQALESSLITEAEWHSFGAAAAVSLAEAAPEGQQGECNAQWEEALKEVVEQQIRPRVQAYLHKSSNSSSSSSSSSSSRAAGGSSSNTSSNGGKGKTLVQCADEVRKANVGGEASSTLLRRTAKLLRNLGGHCDSLAMNQLLFSLSERLRDVNVPVAERAKGAEGVLLAVVGKSNCRTARDERRLLDGVVPTIVSPSGKALLAQAAVLSSATKRVDVVLSSRSNVLEDTEAAFTAQGLLPAKAPLLTPHNIVLNAYFRSSYGHKRVRGETVEEGEGLGPRKELYALLSQSLCSGWKGERQLMSGGGGSYYSQDGITASAQEGTAEVLISINSKSSKEQQTQGVREGMQLRLADGVTTRTITKVYRGGGEGGGGGGGGGGNKIRARVSAMWESSFEGSATVLLEPQQALLKYHQASEACWLNTTLSESPAMLRRLEMLGIVLGLSLVNQCQVGVALPLLFFELLLRQAASADDKDNDNDDCSVGSQATIATLEKVPLSAILALDPSILQSFDKVRAMSPPELRQLLAAEGLPSDTPVEVYLQRSARETFVEPVLWQVRAIRRGFESVLPLHKTPGGLWAAVAPAAHGGSGAEDGGLWTLTARDMRYMCCGTGGEGRQPGQPGQQQQAKDFDFRAVFRLHEEEELRETLPLREVLWKVVQEGLTAAERRGLLLFITGVSSLPEPQTERLSIEMPFTAYGATEQARLLQQIPTSHTCDNILELPNYWTALLHRDKLPVGPSATTKPLKLNVEKRLREELEGILLAKLRVAVANASGGYGLDGLATAAAPPALATASTTAAAPAAAVGASTPSVREEGRGSSSGSGLMPPAAQATAGAAAAPAAGLGAASTRNAAKHAERRSSSSLSDSDDGMLDIPTLADASEDGKSTSKGLAAAAAATTTFGGDAEDDVDSEDDDDFLNFVQKEKQKRKQSVDGAADSIGADVNADAAAAASSGVTKAALEAKPKPESASGREGKDTTQQQEETRKGKSYYGDENDPDIMYDDTYDPSETVGGSKLDMADVPINDLLVTKPREADTSDEEEEEGGPRSGGGYSFSFDEDVLEL